MTLAPEVRYQSVLSRFRAQAAQTPNRLAVRAGDGALTYGELAEHARSIENGLRERGVQSGDRVAVVATPTIDTIAAMIAVWNTSSAFVPIDPSWPKQRVDAILSSAGSQLIIDQATSGPAISIARTAASAASAPLPVESKLLGDAAYVIFTSGTAGQPKGVVIGHAQLAHYARAILEKLDLPEDAEFGAVSTLAADLSYTAIFPALTSGRCVNLIEPDVATNPEELAGRLRQRALHAMKIVPSHLSALLDGASDPKAILPTDALVVGGESFPRSLFNRLQELAPDLRIYNHYGPTETTVGASCVLVEDSVDDRCSFLPVGEGLGETLLTVVDQQGAPADAWQSGEVLISGAGVGMGYLSELAAGRVGFADRGGLDVYRSGDLGRVVPGWGVEILGRLDDQVKLHGYRVQLGEIESLLSRLPLVSACKVEPRADSGGLVSHLDAYVVAQGADIPSLRTELVRQLPAALVPTGWQLLEKLPLTPNGKVDREALLPISHAPTRIERPRDSVEQRLLLLWAAVLDLDTVSPTDDFFLLGGHSLQAIKLISAVNAEFECKLSMTSIFRARTVAAMATLIRSSERGESNLVPLRNGRGAAPIFCIHPGGGSTLSYWELARLLPADRPIVGVDSWGLHGRAPQDNFAEMAETYARDIIKTAGDQPPVLIGWCFGGLMAFETAQAIRRANGQVSTLIVIDSSVPGFHEEGEPLSDSTLIGRFAWHYELDLSGGDDAGYLLQAMRDSGHLPLDAGEDELNTLLGVYRSNMAAIGSQYDGQARLSEPDYPIVLVRAEPADEAPDSDRTWGWATVASAGFTWGSVAADHHGIMRADAVAELAGQIKRALE